MKSKKIDLSKIDWSKYLTKKDIEFIIEDLAGIINNSEEKIINYDCKKIRYELFGYSFFDLIKAGLNQKGINIQGLSMGRSSTILTVVLYNK